MEHIYTASLVYSEAVRIKRASIARGESTPPIEKGSFMQFIFDNADVNVNTLDGKYTFHEMGRIMVITPGSGVLPNIPPLENYMPGHAIASYGLPEVKHKECEKKCWVVFNN